MSISTTHHPLTIPSLGEIVSDFAKAARKMSAAGKLPYQLKNASSLMSEILRWAEEFKEAFAQEAHADDYIKLLNTFAEYRLGGGDASAAHVLTVAKVQIGALSN